MSSKQQKIEVSWGNIEDQIAALLYAMKKIPEDQPISSIKISLPKEIKREALVTLEVTTREEVEVLKF